jgi:signal transduction histidine kinase
MAAEQPDAWERWKLGWQHAFFGFLLALATAGALAHETSTGALLLRLGLLLALAGWYAYWFGLRAAPVSRSATTSYLIGGGALWLALVVIDPAFTIVVFAVLLPLLMRRLAGVAVAVVACLAIGYGVRAATGPGLTWPEGVISALTVGAGIASLGYVAALDREGRRRARLLDELAAAQAELAASERQAGTLIERQRLAREVHDTLTQGFASVVMLLEAVQETRSASDAAGDRRIASALRAARENLAESRRLVWALRPIALDGASLPDAVQRETRRLADETGIATSAVVTGDPARLDDRTEAGLLRVVQEALANARRHARASEVTVTLSYTPDVVLVDVRDDGVGLPDGRPTTGMGLRAMRERATELGGTLTIESERDEGTTVALAAPIRVGAQK